MRIAVLGGTGDFGEGICLRWAVNADHELRIGSRRRERAERAAESYSRRAGREITGHTESEAAEGADIAVLSVPPEEAPDTAAAVASGPDIFVSPAVRMRREEGTFHADPPDAGSVAESVAERVEAPVVAALHPLAAGRLADLEAPLGADVPVAGDDPAARRKVSDAVDDIEGLRPLVAGPLASAREVESLTPLLINLGTNNDIHEPGVRFG